MSFRAQWVAERQRGRGLWSTRRACGAAPGGAGGAGAVCACCVHWLFWGTFELHPLKRLVLKFLDFRPEIPMSVRVSDARRPSRLCPVELRVGSGFPLLLSVLARRVGRRPLQGAALGSCQLSGGRRIVERSPSASVLTKPVHSAVSRGRGPVVTSASSSPSSSAALALGCFSLCLESSHLCAL